MPDSAEKLPKSPAAESDSALADMAQAVRQVFSFEGSGPWEAASQEELEGQLNGYEQIELINPGGYVFSLLLSTLISSFCFIIHSPVIVQK